MNKLSSTAKKLDTFFRILNTFLTIGIVSALVGLGIIAAGFLFDLDPSLIGSGYNTMRIGTLHLALAESYAPDPHAVLVLVAVELALALLCLLIARRCNTCVRDILAPMTRGEPFHTTVSTNLKKLAKFSLVLCLIINLANTAATVMYLFRFDLVSLLISDKITHITFNADLDLTFLLVSAILYLLSCVFRYGEELQQLSDETL